MQIYIPWLHAVTPRQIERLNPLALLWLCDVLFHIPVSVRLKLAIVKMKPLRLHYCALILHQLGNARKLYLLPPCNALETTFLQPPLQSFRTAQQKDSSSQAVSSMGSSLEVRRVEALESTSRSHWTSQTMEKQQHKQET